MVKKIAHRGAHQNCPENTISSFSEAVSLGAQAIEFDVRLCASGEVVVFHDPWLKRMMNGSGNLRKLSLNELRSYGFREAPNEKIPTLEEVLILFGNKIELNIEIKDINIYNHLIARKVADLVDRFQLSDSVWISSFNPLVLDYLKTIAPKVRTGFLFNKLKYMPLLLSSFIHFDSWHPNYELIDESFMQVAKKKGKDVYPWTVNEKEDIERLKSLNVSGIISDFIDYI